MVCYCDSGSADTYDTTCPDAYGCANPNNDSGNADSDTNPKSIHCARLDIGDGYSVHSYPESVFDNVYATYTRRGNFACRS